MFSFLLVVRKFSIFLVFTGTYNTHGELTEVSLRENKKKHVLVAFTPYKISR